jgi:hypothetical protein
MRDRQWQNACRERLSGIPPFVAVSGAFLDNLPMGCAQRMTIVWPYEDLKIVGCTGGEQESGAGIRVNVIGYQLH